MKFFVCWFMRSCSLIAHVISDDSNLRCVRMHACLNLWCAFLWWDLLCNHWCFVVETRSFTLCLHQTVRCWGLMCLTEKKRCIWVRKYDTFLCLFQLKKRTYVRYVHDLYNTQLYVQFILNLFHVNILCVSYTIAANFTSLDLSWVLWFKLFFNLQALQLPFNMGIASI